MLDMIPLLHFLSAWPIILSCGTVPKKINITDLIRSMPIRHPFHRGKKQRGGGGWGMKMNEKQDFDLILFHSTALTTLPMTRKVLQ